MGVPPERYGRTARLSAVVSMRRATRGTRERSRLARGERRDANPLQVCHADRALARKEGDGWLEFAHAARTARRLHPSNAVRAPR